MTLDGFLSFLALFIAFYAIIPPVTRLRAQLHLAAQIPLALVAVLLVLYFEFFSLLGQPCQLPSDKVCSWLIFPKDNSFTPPQAAFLVVFVWIICAWGLNALMKPGTRSLVTISKVVQTLLYEHRFAELVDFIRPHLQLVESAAKRQLLSQRIYDWLANVDWLGRLQISTFKPGELIRNDQQQSNKDRGRRICEIFRQQVRWMRHFLPAGHKIQANSENIARMLLRSDEFRTFLVTMRPDALPDLLAVKLQPRFDFSDKVLRDLLADDGSRLYQEIEQNQNVSDKGGYAIPDENVLLSFFFGNAEIAHTLGVWKPVGDTIINVIRAGTKSGYADYLNDCADNFEDEKWRDVTFLGIRFFDIMVDAAMRQGITYHMWLFYLPKFIKELEKIYDTTKPNIDALNEFPNRNARLIYEAFDVMGDWVRNFKYLDAASPHSAISGRGMFPSGIIPADAALALGEAMMTVALSSRIGDTFAGYLHECVLRDICSLSRTGVEGQMRTMLIQAFVAGGNRPDSVLYGDRLKTFVAQTDHVLRGQVSDYTEALVVAYPE